MISRYFPPMFDIAGKRAYRFARYLPQFGWRAVIVTGKIPSRRPIDQTPLCLPPQTRVARVYDPFWSFELGQRPSDGTVAAPLSGSSVLSKLQRVLGVPVGHDLAFSPHVVRQATRLGRDERADVVFATSAPYATLVQGRQVARALGRPLVLDLRDPWTLNFFQRDQPRWAAAVDRRVERALFHEADRVILNCEAALTAYKHQYADLPSDRMLAIRNSFDPADRPPDPEARVGPIRLLHFGNCYGPRRLDTILRAMALVRARRPDAPEVVLENLGRVSAADIELARELGQRFVHGVFVPLAEGLRRLAGADLALLLGYGAETLYIPAKLYDYLLTRAPIACVASPGELTDLVERSGAGQVIHPGDVEGMAGLIQRAIDARARREPAFVPDDQQLAPHSSVETARALAKVLDELSGA